MPNVGRGAAVVAPAPAAGRAADERGFSLVEIAVVLAVVALLIAAAQPSLQGWKDALDLRNAASGVMDLMLSSRMKSIVERRNYTVSVDYTANSLGAAPGGTAFSPPGSVLLYRDDTDPDCPSLSARDVVFRPNSTADAAGFEAVYLKSRNSRRPVRYRVKVLGATGKVGIEKWTGNEWLSSY
jgi:prepilin-type N-terminal cleavage/methylation domain-containing protein